MTQSSSPSRNARKMLNDLSELMAQKTIAEMDKADLVKSVVPADVQAKLNEIDAEFDDRVAEIDERIKVLSEEIREWVKYTGETAKGETLMAVYNKPRVQWDTAALDGMAKLIPQIREARSESEPSVTIRKR